jgi:hypothetical protein
MREATTKFRRRRYLVVSENCARWLVGLCKHTWADINLLQYYVCCVNARSGKPQEEALRGVCPCFQSLLAAGLRTDGYCQLVCACRDGLPPLFDLPSSLQLAEYICRQGLAAASHNPKWLDWSRQPVPVPFSPRPKPMPLSNHPATTALGRFR